MTRFLCDKRNFAKLGGCAVLYFILCPEPTSQDAQPHVQPGVHTPFI
jgi:hypothetical protein